MKYVLILILTNSTNGTSTIYHIPDYTEERCEGAKNIWLLHSPTPRKFEKTAMCIPQ